MLPVVEGELWALGMLGERRKRGGTSYHHVGETSLKAMLGELGEMGQLRVLDVWGAKRRTTGKWAPLYSSKGGHTLQRWGDGLDVEAMVMVVRWRGLDAAHVTVLCV